jgi:hypothetical protein
VGASAGIRCEVLARDALGEQRKENVSRAVISRNEVLLSGSPCESRCPTWRTSQVSTYLISAEVKPLVGVGCPDLSAVADYQTTESIAVMRNGTVTVTRRPSTTRSNGGTGCMRSITAGRSSPRSSAGLGVRGERLYDWAWATLPHFGDLPAGYARTLLARRSLVIDEACGPGSFSGSDKFPPSSGGLEMLAVHAGHPIAETYGDPYRSSTTPLTGGCKRHW